tara:strand:- start:1909 stop:2295 length:387 start_codon:yes stop_codon:yes gene_type:complete
MAHFAKINIDTDEVVDVIVVSNNDIVDENGVEQESIGVRFIENLYSRDRNHYWKQTSYNKQFRGNYAQIGGHYNKVADMFIPYKEFDSWVWNSEKLDWEAPVPRPENEDRNIFWYWDESAQEWIEGTT